MNVKNLSLAILSSTKAVPLAAKAEIAIAAKKVDQPERVYCAAPKQEVIHVTPDDLGSAFLGSIFGS